MARAMALIVLAILGLSRFAAAQTGVTTVVGAIDGTVSDETGAPIPGVTLTLTSPALIVQQMTAVSATDGRYRFNDLPVGTYHLQAEVQGFQTFVRENLQLTAGFAARVDVLLKVGSVSETVVVSGASPVIDVTTTSGGQTLSTQVIESTLPTLGHEADLVKLTPGTLGGVGTRAANPGATGLLANMSMSAYGQAGVTALVEDFEMHSNNQPPNGTDTVEQSVKTYGNGPEVQYAGAAVNYVFSSGGNEFHGDADGYFMNQRLESSNLTAALKANGLIGNEAIQTYGEGHANVGGPIVKDRLWVFLTGRESNSTRTIGGFVTAPGSTDLVSVPGHRNGNVFKVTDQLSPRNQLTGLWWHDNVKDWGDCSTGYEPGGNCRTIPESASAIYYLYDNVWYGEYKTTPNNKLTVDFKAGRSSYHTKYDIKPGFENDPSGYDLATQQFYGSPIATGTLTTAQRFGTTYFWQSTGNVTYIPGGIFGTSNTFKAGFRSNLSTAGGEVPNHPAGNYMQIWNNAQPFELVTFSFPLNALSSLNIDSFYGSDNWQLAKRVTLNLGLRYDYEHSYIPPETQEASTFVAGKSYPLIDVGTFNLWSPRAAVAWDVSGSGKTVMKATYGRYNQMLPYYTTNFADMYNPVVATVGTYSWTPQSACGLAACAPFTPFQLGQVNTAPGSPALLNVTGPLNTVPLSSSFVVPHVNEYTASLERELMANFSLRLLYVFKQTLNAYDQVNVGIPGSAFSIAKQVTSPLGQVTTAYDYPVSAKSFLYARINRPDSQDDHSNNFEIAANKRLSNHWSLLASWDELKQHVWLTTPGIPAGISYNPNYQNFPINETWNYVLRFSSSYELPYQILVAGTLNVLNGIQGQQIGVFTGFNQGAVSLALSPYGAVTGPVQKYLDLRAAKTFRLGQQRRTLQFSLDVFNALNTSAAQAESFTEGKTYLNVSQISNPRIAKLGATLGF